ncbi:MAG: GNAT family N-acetyltransferase [Chitinophagales bacterium]
MDIIIRKGVAADMEAVHGLVCELAEYERSLAEVKTGPDEFKQALERHAFQTLLACNAESGEILGAALYYFAYSTWKGSYLWLEDFIVRSAYRRQGIGKLLFDAVVDIAAEQNSFMKWQVLDWNTSAMDFYAQYNSEVQNEWLTCRLTTRS